MKLREIMPALTGATEWLNKEVTSEQLIGVKPTFIHYWSVSCHLCKKAMPQVNEIRDTYKEQLNIVAVHMPRTEEDYILDNIRKVAHEHNIIQPLFVDGKRLLSSAFDNKCVPAYYVFDKEGKLRHFQAGGSNLKMIEKRIMRVVAESERT